MKLKLLYTFLLLTTLVFGQKIKDKDLIGTWKTEHIRVLETNKAFADKIPALKAIFVNSIFTFKADHKFLISSNMSEMDDLFSNKYWTLDSQQKMVRILENKGEEKSNDNLMEITVTKLEKGLLMQLKDTPLELTMKKQ